MLKLSGITTSRTATVGSLGLTGDVTRIWVAAGGDDTNGNGTESKPLATIAAALALINAGDTGDYALHLGPGTFSWNLETSVTSGDRNILVIGAGKQATIISMTRSGSGDRIISCTGLQNLTLNLVASTTGTVLIYPYGISEYFFTRECAISSDNSLMIVGRLNGSIVGSTFNAVTGQITIATTTINCAFSGNAISIGAARGCKSTATTITAIGSFFYHNSFIGESVRISVSDAQSARAEIIGNTISASDMLSSSGMILCSDADLESCVIRGNDIYYSGPWGEETDIGYPLGLVMIIHRRLTDCDLRIVNNTIKSTCIAIFDGHPNPVNDSTLSTSDRLTEISGNTIEFECEATVGPPDAHAAILRYGRGRCLVERNTIRTLLSASTDTDLPHAAIHINGEVSAGTSVVDIYNNVFETTLPAGAVDNKKFSAVNAKDGTTDATVTIGNCTIISDGNEDYTFGGKGTPSTTVIGVLLSNGTVTFENAPEFEGATINGVLLEPSTFGASLVASTDAGEGRTTLGLASSTTDNTLTRFDGTTGATQGSGVTVDDSNNMAVPGAITGRANIIALNNTSRVLLASESGSIVHAIFMDGKTITLPDAAAGLEFTLDIDGPEGDVTLIANVNFEDVPGVTSGADSASTVVTTVDAFVKMYCTGASPSGRWRIYIAGPGDPSPAWSSV